jgi:hypothetical protein
MSELVIEVGYQVPSNAVYVRVSGEETRVTINPKPDAEVLATLRDDIVDAIIELSYKEPEPRGDSEMPPSKAEVSATDVADTRET